MLKPKRPLDETMRLKSLHSMRLLDTPSEERFDRVTRMAQRVFNVDSCLVSLVDADRQWFKSKQGLDACETPRDISFCGHAILDDRMLVIPDASADPRFADNPLVTGDPFIRFYAGCPIRGPHGYRIGTFCIIDAKPRRFPPEDREALRDLAALVEDELALVSQTTVDDLTQVANRRGFNMVASHMLSLCRRTATPAELLFFDLNEFKAVNDELGHSFGDELLKSFAGLLLKCFRSADVIARLGGDEFVVLLAGSSGESGTAVERLTKLAAGLDDTIKDRLSWSVGQIRFDPQRHGTVEDLLAEADSRMYEDKAQRRNNDSPSAG